MKNIKKNYQEKLLDYFSYVNQKDKNENKTILDDEVYQSILKSKSEAELNKSFLLELELRYRTINLLLECNEIPDKMFKNIKFDTTEEYLEIVKNYFRLIKELKFIKDTDIKIKYISLKKLLFNVEFKDSVVDNLNHNIKSFYSDSILNQKMMFFDFYSFGFLFDREQEFALYCKIKNNIFKYIYKGNIQFFETHCKNTIGSNYKSTMEYKDYINNYIEDEIFNDLSITIDYLKKIDVYDKCIEQLREAYDKFVGRKQIITLGIDRFDYYNKNMVSLEMNFDLPIEVLEEQLRYAYELYGLTLNDYKLLFNKSKEINVIECIKKLGNRTNLKKYLEENEFLNFDIKHRNILIKNQLLIINLFIFDSIYLGLDIKNIDKIFTLKYIDFDYNSEMINNKMNYFKEIFNMIKNKQF